MSTSYSTPRTVQSGGTLSHALPELTSRWKTTTGVITKSSAISELEFIDLFHIVSAYLNVSGRTERLRDWSGYRTTFSLILSSQVFTSLSMDSSVFSVLKLCEFV